MPDAQQTKHLSAADVWRMYGEGLQAAENAILKMGEYHAQAVEALRVSLSAFHNYILEKETPVKAMQDSPDGALSVMEMSLDPQHCRVDGKAVGGDILNDVGDQAGGWWLELVVVFRDVERRLTVPAAAFDMELLARLGEAAETEALRVAEESPADCVRCGSLAWPCECKPHWPLKDWPQQPDEEEE